MDVNWARTISKPGPVHRDDRRDEKIFGECAPNATLIEILSFIGRTKMLSRSAVAALLDARLRSQIQIHSGPSDSDERSGSGSSVCL